MLYLGKGEVESSILSGSTSELAGSEPVFADGTPERRVRARHKMPERASNRRGKVGGFVLGPNRAPPRRHQRPRIAAAFWRPVGILYLTLPALTLPALTLTACSSAQQAQVLAFEQRAAPVVAQACARLHSVESNPLLQGAINIGIDAASGATSGIAGVAIGMVKGMGDAYCANGPPLGDTTTPEEQAQWLLGQIIPPLQRATGH